MPSRLKLRPRATPPTPPADTEVVFLDEADGVLKIIDDTGAVNAFSGAGSDTRVVVDLSAAQIRTLDTVPVEVIPAPGAGKTLWLKEWLWQYTFGTVAYAAGLVQLRWVGSATYNVQVEQGFTLDSPVSRVGSEPLAAYYDDDVDAEDRALEVFAGNTPPGVSGDGTARLIVDYEIVTLA